MCMLACVLYWFIAVPCRHYHNSAIIEGRHKTWQSSEAGDDVMYVCMCEVKGHLCVQKLVEVLP